MLFCALLFTTWMLIGTVKVRFFGDGGVLICITDPRNVGTATWMTWPALFSCWLLWPFPSQSIAHWWFMLALERGSMTDEQRIRETLVYGPEDTMSVLYPSHMLTDLYSRTWKEMK